MPSWSGLFKTVRSFLLPSCLLLGSHVFAKAQYFPNLSNPVQQSSSITPQFAVSSAVVPSTYYGGNVVMSAFAQGYYAGVAISTDGSTYQAPLTLTNLPAPDCSEGFYDLCGVGIASYQGYVYLAYADQGQNLIIAVGTPDPHDPGYTFTELQSISGAQVVTAPTLAVLGNTLAIVYGSSAYGIKNGYAQVTCTTVNTQCSGPNTQTLASAGVASAATPAIAQLNGALWMCIQQNNSQHNMFVYKSTDGVTWQYVEEASNVQMGGGAQMINYNNNLVLAVQQNNSNRYLFLFSSTDGINWSYKEYTQAQVGGTNGASPGIATINSNIAVAFRSNNPNASGQLLFTMFGR